MPESTNLLPGHGSLVTGAGRGLGAALVLDLLAQGHSCCTLSSESWLEQLRIKARAEDLAERLLLRGVR